mgnify:FL=1
MKMQDDYSNPTEGTTVRRYEIYIYAEDMKREFTQEEKDILRPIAEVIAVLDGNAFFRVNIGDSTEWYEQYLPEAWAIFNNSGGFDGAIMDASWVREQRPTNPAVKASYEAYQTMRKLANDD